MNDFIFVDENGICKFDFSKSIFAIELHDKFRNCCYLLSDVDFIAETEDKVIFVEYKNTDIPNVRNPQALEIKITDSNQYLKHCIEIARKYYDSLLYIMACGKFKKFEYIYILECKKADIIIRKRLISQIIKRLPFQIQRDKDIKNPMISDFQLLNINEWNNKYGGEFPITPI